MNRVTYRVHCRTCQADRTVGAWSVHGWLLDDYAYVSFRCEHCATPSVVPVIGRRMRDVYENAGVTFEAILVGVS